MNHAMRTRIADATVKLPRMVGQGIIVSDGLIVTAAHVICGTVTGDMTLAPEEYWEQVEIGGRTFRARIYAAEPVSDIAFLGCPDDQYDTEGADGFEAALEDVKPVQICTTEFPLFEMFPVHILAHTGRWIAGEAQQCQVEGRGIVVHASEHITGGTSGGPVVTNDGRLLGVVTQFQEGCGVNGSCDGIMPRLHLTAPVWIARRICAVTPLAHRALNRKRVYRPKERTTKK